MHATEKALGLIAVFFLLAGGRAGAHIGSPNVYFDGPAGPYPVRIVLRPPAAIPGRAEITVTVQGEAITQVTALPVPQDAPAAMLPPPDAVLPVAGAPGVYSAELWIMTQGPCAVRVRVAGSQGEGEALVPMNAVNLAPRAMPAWLGASLVVLGVLLVGGVILIAAAIVREAHLPPGKAPTDQRRRTARLAGMASGLAAVLLIAGGWTAWQRMDRAYRNNQLFKPIPMTAEVRPAGADRLLTLTRQPDERGSRAWPRLVTDHGKLMHAFLLREPALDVFAHIHPFPASGDAFVSALPPLPAGMYRVYADITQENGLSQTLTTMVPVPDAPASASKPDSGRILPDPDDSWHTGPAFDGTGRPTGNTAALGDGYRMVWDNPEEIDRPGERVLRFTVLDAAGNPAQLTPYMGMMGHAAIRREDGAVFAHLHPTGSISMAAQALMAEKTSGTGAGSGGMEGMDHSMHRMSPDTPDVHRIAFPYEFPQTGPYRLWVQVRVGERVMTGVFDARVTRAGGA